MMGLTSCKHSHQCVASIALVSPPRQSMALCAVLSCAQHAGFCLTSSHQCIPLLFFLFFYFFITALLFCLHHIQHRLHWYTAHSRRVNVLMMKHKYEGVIFSRFSLHIVITQGRDEEEGDRELMASSDPSAKSCFLRLCCCLHACDREDRKSVV